MNKPTLEDMQKDIGRAPNGMQDFMVWVFPKMQKMTEQLEQQAGAVASQMFAECETVVDAKNVTREAVLQRTRLKLDWQRKYDEMMEKSIYEYVDRQLDRYNRGELDAEELKVTTAWASRGEQIDGVKITR